MACSEKKKNRIIRKKNFECVWIDRCKNKIIHDIHYEEEKSRIPLEICSL